MRAGAAGAVLLMTSISTLRPTANRHRLHFVMVIANSAGQLLYQPHRLPTARIGNG